MARQATKAQYILGIEKIWEAYSLNDRSAQQLERLLAELRFTISKKAAAASRRWNNKRIPAAGFESAFFYEAWRVSDSYHQYTVYYFYKTLCQGFERREIDVVRRHTKARQKAFEISILPPSKGAESFLPNDIDVEKVVTDHLLVQQMLDDPVLSTEEYALLKAIHDNLGASYREIAIDVGVVHHERVRRMLRKIRDKLDAYGDYL